VKLSITCQGRGGLTTVSHGPVGLPSFAMVVPFQLRDVRSPMCGLEVFEIKINSLRMQC
jgi:hypothetical protein